MRGGIQFALCAAGEREQLLKVLRGQREIANGGGFDGLAGSGISGVYLLHFRLHINLLLDGLRLELGDEACGFSDADHDVAKGGVAETGAAHANRVGSGRQKCSGKRSVGAGGDDAFHNSRALIGDAYFSIGDGRAGGVGDGAGDGAGGAALSEGLGKECSCEKTYPDQPDL